MKSSFWNTKSSAFLFFLAISSQLFSALPIRAEEGTSFPPEPPLFPEVLAESTLEDIEDVTENSSNKIHEIHLAALPEQNSAESTFDDLATPLSSEPLSPEPSLDRFHRALRERDLSIGYGKKMPLSRFHPRTKITVYQVIPRWGRFRDSRQEFLWELPITYVSSPDTAYAAGLTLMYRFHFSSNRDFAPFVELGSGFVFTNLDRKVRELSRSFNFSPQVGVGFRKAIGPSSDLVFSARWFHLSNAGTRAPNIGLNNYLLTAGYSRLF